MTQSGHSGVVGTCVKFDIVNRPEGDMKRRSAAKGRSSKRRRAFAPKARKAPTAHASTTDLQDQVAALTGALQSYVDERRRNPVFRPAPATTLARALAAKKPVQDADALNQPQLGAIVKFAGARTILSV